MEARIQQLVEVPKDPWFKEKWLREGLYHSSDRMFSLNEVWTSNRLFLALHHFERHHVRDGPRAQQVMISAGALTSNREYYEHVHGMAPAATADTGLGKRKAAALVEPQNKLTAEEKEIRSLKKKVVSLKKRNRALEVEQQELKKVRLLNSEKKERGSFSCLCFSRDVGVNLEAELWEKMKMFSFTGLSHSQVDHLYALLEVASFSHLTTRHEEGAGGAFSTKQKPLVLVKDRLIATLVLLRTAMTLEQVGALFGRSANWASGIVEATLQLMAIVYQTYYMRVPRAVVQETTPASYQSLVEDGVTVRIIFDCAETTLQTFNNKEKQRASYSSYKSKNTLKWGIGITPGGLINFITDTYAGSITDEELVKICGLCGMLDKNDGVLADKGFSGLHLHLLSHELSLILPPKKLAGLRFSTTENASTARIASLRVHVERAISNMRNFRFVSNEVPITLMHIFKDALYAVAFLVTLVYMPSTAHDGPPTLFDEEA